MITLSNRLRTIAEQVPQGSRLADIGSDHALLPAFLAEDKRISFAVAGEVNQGPYEAASKQVKEAGLEAVISVRKGDGLAVVRAGEVDTVTIAGMGGNLIVHILTEGQAKLEGMRRLILQPNVGEEAVRRWLHGNGWLLAEERILEEDDKIYEILTAVPAEPEREADAVYKPYTLEGFGAVTSDLMFQFGPYLLREASAVFVEKWRRETTKLQRVAEELKRSDLEEAARKRETLLAEIKQIKELISCLQKGKPSFN